MGRHSKRTPEVINRIIEGLSAGTPLTVICRPNDMPSHSTVYDWASADEELSARIARARELGFDAIAMEALAIADDSALDTIETDRGKSLDKEWVQRSKLRVETRLKLLAKWDPKRYGEMIKHAGADAGPMQISVSSEDALL